MTRSRPSGSAIDAEAAVGRILNKFRIAQGWNAESPEDHALRVAAWLEILGIAEIPVEQYDDLYRRAMATRMRREAAGEKLFALTPGELVAEYRAKAARDAARAAEQDRPDAVDVCPDRHDHRSPDEALRDYGFPGGPEEWLPCHVCRPKAFGRRRADTIAARGAAARAERTRRQVLQLVAVNRQREESAPIDAEIDAITASLRDNPGNEVLQRRYADLIAAKAARTER